jgi:tetratricopeptide (TPR) repeat protein
MKIKLLQKILLITSMTLFVGFQIQAQTLKDAIDAYNTGMDLVGSDIEAAIESIKRSHEMASQLGAEGEEVREQAEIQLPGLYYDKAMGHYRERNIDQAVEGFEEAIAISEKFDDAGSKRRSENVLHQLYAIQGNTEFRENNHEEALSLFDKALEINPQHARSYLGKGLVYRRLEDTENFRKAMDMAIETGLATGEEQITQTAESTARDYFLVRAVRAKGEGNFDTTIEMLNTSLNYDESFPEAHFLLSATYNEQSRYQDAVNSARRAIDLSNGNREETAKMYFELAKAYEGLGDTAQACNAYSLSAFGNYEASAKYQMEHVLKCP